MSDRKKLEKLVIRSFANRDFSGEDTTRMFTTPINPESFTKNYKVSIDAETGHGSPGAEAKYRSTAPEELKLDFVLDGTKTLEGYGGDNKEYINTPVERQLRDFLNCAYNMDGLI